MPILRGNATGSIIGVPYNLSATIESFSLVNMTGGSITATVSIIEYGTNDKVAVDSQTIATAATYKSDIPIKVLSGFTIYLVVSGSCDYYFNIK